MPLSRWAKMLMLAQSAIALSTVALVVARAVNILRRLAHGPDRDVPSPHV